MDDERLSKIAAAFVAQNEWDKDNPNPTVDELRACPVNRALLTDGLEVAERRLKYGDDAAVLEGLLHCAIHRAPMPDWLAEAFIERHKKVRGYEAASWDDVFGRPHKKGLHLESARRRHKNKMLVFFRIRELHVNEGEPICAELFERVGREVGLSKTVCEELYYQLWHISDNYPEVQTTFEYEGRKVTFEPGALRRSKRS